MISCSGDGVGRGPTYDTVGSSTEGDVTEGSGGEADDDAGETGGDPTQASTSGATAEDGTDAGGSTGGESTAGESTSGGAQDGGSFWLLDAVYAPDMTADGSTVLVGDNATGAIFRWDEVNGLEMVASAPFELRSISDDATRIAASIADPNGSQVAAVWDEGIGWTGLGDLGACDSIRSASYDMSGDGSIVVGLGWDACSGVAFWWEDGQAMAALPVLEDGNNRASALSRDGKVAAGFAQTAGRSPALWWDDGSTLVPNPNFMGEFHAISDDGSLAAGSGFHQAMYWTANEGIVNLGNLEAIGEFDHTRILGVCNGGQMLIGSEAGPFGSGTAIVWTPQDGLRAFADLLDEYDVEVPAEVLRLERAVSCSADGTRVAGTAVHATEGLKAFVVDLLDPPDPPDPPPG